MGVSLNAVKDAALSLDLDARAKLVESLILSIDLPSEAENLQLWVEEAESRLRELRSGKAREIPAADVFSDIRSKLSC